MADNAPPPGKGGPLNRRRIVVIGGVAVVVIVGYAYLRNRNSGGVAVDPATGSTGGTGYVNPNPGADGFEEVQSDDGLITTDAEWTAAVLEKFEARNIYDPSAAAIILGKYLAGLALTQEEATVVRTAWGIAGYPPSNTQLHLTQTSTPGTPTPPPTTTPGTPKPAPPRRYVTTGVYGQTSPAWKNTLSGIAGHTGRSVSQLQTWNGIADRNVIPSRSRIWIDPPGTYNGSTEFK